MCNTTKFKHEEQNYLTIIAMCDIALSRVIVWLILYHDQICGAIATDKLITSRRLLCHPGVTSLRYFVEKTYRSLLSSEIERITSCLIYSQTKIFKYVGKLKKTSTVVGF